MTVFVVRVGKCKELDYCLEIIKNYLTKHNIKYYVLTEKIDNFHPSWFKLRAFEYVDDDFILCWDLDLLPKKNAPNILTNLDFNKINLAVDSAVMLNIKEAGKQLKYNCGLIGIPKKYKDMFSKLYKHANNTAPFEQNYINDIIRQQNIDIHEIDKRFNTLYYTCRENIKNLISSFFTHYTALNLTSNERNFLIKKHYSKYFNNDKRKNI
jgi:hypothetical protein